MMNAETILEPIRKYLSAKTLAPAPEYPGDPHAGLMVQQRDTAKYTFDPDGRLRGLNLANCGLDDDAWQSLLRELGEHATGLRDLNLAGNRLSRFDFLPELARLEQLNLSRNEHLTQLVFSTPPARLEKLFLRETGLPALALPAGPDRLKWLDLRGSQLQRIDFEGRLPALEWLDLSENQLADLRVPKAADGLVFLYLHKNQLKRLQFDRPLRRLRLLHLRDNKLDALPENLPECVALETLYLHGNNWQGNLASVIPNGEDANAVDPVRDYLRELRKGDKPNDRVKIIIVGNGRVGKTSMFRRLKGWPYRKDEKFTHGVQLGDLGKEELPSVKTGGLQANVWDFGGQEIFYATHQFFLTDNAVYVLAWTAEQNVLAYRERDKADLPLDEKWRPREYWLDNIRRHAPNSPLLLVQTHCCAHREPYDQTAYTRPPFEAECHEFDASDDTGLPRLKELLTERLNTGVPHFGEKFPETYDRVIGEIERLGWEKNKIPRSEFDALCRKAGITQGGETSVLEFLRVTGSVVWFPEGKALQDTVFINPNWLTRQVYRLINNQLRNKKGRFDREYARHILDDHTGAEQEQFLELLQQFELIFKAGDDLFIAPQYLPDQLDEELRNAYEIIRDDLQPAFRFRFPKFVPDNVMVNFLSRYGPFSKQLYWKNGICFRTADKSNGIVIFDEPTSSLEVLTARDSPEAFHLQAEVCRAFVELSKNANAEIALDGKPFVSWQELVDAEKDGIDVIRATDHSKVVVADYARFWGKEMERKEEGRVEEESVSLTSPLKQNPPMLKKTPRIFFSYAWGDANETGTSREVIVDQLFESLERDGFDVVRDKKDLSYGGLISEFMETIGAGDLIVVFISDKYARSPYCMFELYEIARNSKFDKKDFSRRVLPVVVEFIRFDDPDVLDQYFEHWDQEEKKWSSFVTKRIDQIKEAQTRRLHITQRIKAEFGNLTDWLADINASKTRLLAENDFDPVKQTILKRLSPDIP